MESWVQQYASRASSLYFISLRLRCPLYIGRQFVEKGYFAITSCYDCPCLTSSMVWDSRTLFFSGEGAPSCKKQYAERLGVRVTSDFRAIPSEHFLRETKEFVRQNSMKKLFLPLLRCRSTARRARSSKPQFKGESPFPIHSIDKWGYVKGCNHTESRNSVNLSPSYDESLKFK